LDGGGAAHETRLLMLGGDHSNTLAGLRAAHARHGEPAGGLALIHFDAHLDTVDTVWGETHGHASPFIRAIEEGVLDPKRTLTVGIRGPLSDAADLEYARDHGITIVTREACLPGGDGVATINGFLEDLGEAPAYVTFDIDAVDPVYAPGTGTPQVGGFSSIETLELLRLVAQAKPNVVGADVVEVLPDRDVSGVTALLAAHVAFEVLAADAVRRG
jgi:arginase family enzyme